MARDEAVTIKCWDKDRLSRDDLIGETEVILSSAKGKEHLPPARTHAHTHTCESEPRHPSV